MRAGASFGELLRQHRLETGITQETLAESARMSVAAISALERGVRRAPYRATVALLAQALGLTSEVRDAFEAAADHGRGRERRGGRSAASHNLPARLTSFIGREPQIGEITALLEQHRLVTLTGSGGVGKTRSAVEAARALLTRKDEVWFVDLAPLERGEFVVSTIAGAIGIPQLPEGDSLASLVALLRERSCLVILDNCEHVVADAATATAAILRACPDITVLATSRERLAIEGEQVYRLPSMIAEEALRLLTERAGSGDTRLVLTGDELEAGAAICRRLGGIPLAIELAATRVLALGVSALDRHLTNNLAIPGARDLPERQRTMQATIAWSYALLSEPERTLLRSLSVFRRTMTLDAVEAVGTSDLVSRDRISELLSLLVAKSLVEVTVAGDRREYSILESVRAFAGEKLVESGIETLVRRQYATWLAGLADFANQRYEALHRSQWLIEFWPHLSDIRSALAWATESGTGGDVLLAGRIAGGFRGLWIAASSYRELRQWLQAIWPRIDDASNPGVAALLMRARIQTSPQGPEMRALIERAIPLFERIGDRNGLVGIHMQLAYEHAATGDFVQAYDVFDKACVLAHDDSGPRSVTRARLAQQRFAIDLIAGRIDDAERAFHEWARHLEQLGVDSSETAFLEVALALARGDPVRALDLFAQRDASRNASIVKPAAYANSVAAAHLMLGNVDAAEAAAYDALDYALSQELPSTRYWAIQTLATVAAHRGAPTVGAKLLGFVESWRRSIPRIRTPELQTVYTILMTSLRAQLSDEAIDGFQAEGAALDWERVLALVQR